MINLYLSSDGKHTVHVSANTADEFNQLAPVAKTLYERIIKTYGNKAQMWQTYAQANGHQPPLRRGEKLPPEEKAPLCPIHKQPMGLRQGKYGSFWSCNQRQPDGRWCPVTKPISTGQAMPDKIIEQ